MTQTLTVTEEGKDCRLDAFLSGQLEGLSRSYIQKVLKGGGVTVNGKPEKSSYRLVPGDQVAIDVPEPEELLETVMAGESPTEGQLGAAIALVMMAIVVVCMLVMNRFGDGEEQAVML